MIRFGAYLVLGGATAGLARAQSPVQSVSGIVRELTDGGRAIAGAEVIIGSRPPYLTNAQGRFRVDSLRPGQYAVTIRRIGYRPLYSKVGVLASGPTEVEYALAPAPHILPVLEAEARRTGVFGIVADTALRPIAGAKVYILGPRGGEIVTDSSGRFAFPNAHGGTYMVRIVTPGYPERRKALEVPKQQGRELSFRLAPGSDERQAPGEAEALWELRGRLAFLFRSTRMTTSEIQRFGSMRLCDVPKINVLAGSPTTVVVNGVTVLREVSLCSWRMDQVELLEFCSQGACPNPDAPLPLRYPDPSGRRRPGGAIVIWEKR